MRCYRHEGESEGNKLNNLENIRYSTEMVENFHDKIMLDVDIYLFFFYFFSTHFRAFLSCSCRTNQLSKPIDKNASTHLIRNALAGTDYGIDQERLLHTLSLPPDIVRLFRDDITITILYFDSEYLRNMPA